jgi:hypothetical protein
MTKHPIFTQRHYDAIASMLSEVHFDLADTHYGDDEADEQWRCIRDNFSAMFAKDNPRFKPDKFKFACDK